MTIKSHSMDRTPFMAAPCVIRESSATRKDVRGIDVSVYSGDMIDTMFTLESLSTKKPIPTGKKDRMDYQSDMKERTSTSFGR